MSEKYKTYPGNLYFLTMTVEGWIDLFTRKEYAEFSVGADFQVRVYYAENIYVFVLK